MHEVGAKKFSVIEETVIQVSLWHKYKGKLALLDVSPILWVGKSVANVSQRIVACEIMLLYV